MHNEIEHGGTHEGLGHVESVRASASEPKRRPRLSLEERESRAKAELDDIAGKRAAIVAKMLADAVCALSTLRHHAKLYAMPIETRAKAALEALERAQ